MFSLKGKRKIIVDNTVYYWCVTTDRETGIEPIQLTVFDESHPLFHCQYDYENKKWLQLPGNSVRSCILGEAPSITPSLVKALIEECRQTNE